MSRSRNAPGMLSCLKSGPNTSTVWCATSAAYSRFPVWARPVKTAPGTLVPCSAVVDGLAEVVPTVGAQPAMTPFSVANRNTAGALVFVLLSLTANPGLPPATVVLKAWPVGRPPGIETTRPTGFSLAEVLSAPLYSVVLAWPSLETQSGPCGNSDTPHGLITFGSTVGVSRGLSETRSVLANAKVTPGCADARPVPAGSTRAATAPVASTPLTRLKRAPVVLGMPNSLCAATGNSER